MKKQLKGYRVFDISTPKNSKVDYDNIDIAVKCSDMDPDGQWVIINYAGRQSGKSSALFRSFGHKNVVHCNPDNIAWKGTRYMTFRTKIDDNYNDDVDLILIDQPERFTDDDIDALDRLIKSEDHPTIVMMVCREYSDGLIADYIR